MDKASSSEDVRTKLEELTREQVIRFAWLCAVRALPFMGGFKLSGFKDNFYFWKESNRQHRIYTILNLLDIAYIYIDAVAYADDRNNRFDAFNAAAAADNAGTYFNAFYLATDPDASYIDLDPDTCAAASEACYSAASAVRAVYYAASIVRTPSVDIGAAAGAYASAVAASAYATLATSHSNRYTNMETDFKRVLLQDLDNIQYNLPTLQNRYSDWYEEIRNNFQKALEAEDCIYWARLYENIFDNELKVDMAALERRLNVKKKLKNKEHLRLLDI